VASRCGVSREQQDEWAVVSQARAVAARDGGHFDAEIVPVTVPGTRKQPARTIVRDEHPRSDTSLAALAALRPIRLAVDPDSTVTAGNASGQNDGAAVAVVTTPANAERLGLRPLAVLRGWSVAGVDPRRMGIGPVAAVAKVLSRLDLSLQEMDLIELNEAFAAQVLAVTRSWGFGEADWGRVNVHGSGIALGHPIGATGTRILTTMLREMDRREARFGLETMCIGGGQGMAAVFERWDA
jgi:acetyl-CoA C-acetyltransferase